MHNNYSSAGLFCILTVLSIASSHNSLGVLSVDSQLRCYNNVKMKRCQCKSIK